LLARVKIWYNIKSNGGILMNSMIITLLIAVFIILLCIGLLGIGLVLTGKSKIRGGMCGRVPTKKRDESDGCGSNITCSLCSPNNKDDEKK
jgi:hypothetical protein